MNARAVVEATMVIRIVIERTEPLAGTAATAGGDPVGFEGWLELLRVLAELVGEGDRPGRG